MCFAKSTLLSFCSRAMFFDPKIAFLAPRRRFSPPGSLVMPCALTPCMLHVPSQLVTKWMTSRAQNDPTVRERFEEALASNLAVRELRRDLEASPSKSRHELEKAVDAVATALLDTARAVVGQCEIDPTNPKGFNRGFSIDGTCSMHGVRAHGITVPYKKQHGRVPR